MDTESYLLLLLSDGNLPTGSFVASSGLESYVAHALFPISGKDAMSATIAFIRDSLGTYSRSALPFLGDAHEIVTNFAISSVSPSTSQEASSSALAKALGSLTQLDALYESITLNHVTRRASRAQGVALLTLYSKGFVCPPSLATPGDQEDAYLSKNRGERALSNLVDRLKMMIRREESPGHLPICWAILTAALGLNIDRSVHLHLFLHSRGLLSAAIRMNALGPYAAQQLLLHAVRPLVDAEAERARASGLTTRSILQGTEERTSPGSSQNDEDQQVFDEVTHGPASTWPLGEIIAARHDLLHSRIFNS